MTQREGKRKDSFIYQFERNVLAMICGNEMTAPGQTVLCAVSGGADSVCLLTVLKELSGQLGIKVAAVHVEHGIRGEESLADAHYVEKLCQSYGVPLLVEHIRALELAAESGRSVEEEARVQRYRVFLKAAERFGAHRVAVAHSRKDQAETVLWNLTRGSSIRGLSGIRPVRKLAAQTDGSEIFVIRPLLCAGREEIEEYLRRKGVPHRTDRTNLDQAITRNRIRLDILPGLTELNARAEEHIAMAAESLSEIEDYLGRVTERAAGRCIQGEKLLLEPFLKEDPVIRKRVLRECIRQAMPGESLKDIGEVHVDDLMRLAGAGGGKAVSLPKGVTAIREDGIIRFLREKEEAGGKDSVYAADADEAGEDAVPLFPADSASGTDGISVRVPFSGEKTIRIGDFDFILSCRQEGPGPVSIPEKQFTKRIAYDTISVNKEETVCFRTRRPGDFLLVKAGGGRKKISDYLTDRKVPGSLRDRVILLTEGSHVLWVVGGRISEGAKVTPEARYLEVRCVPHAGETSRDGPEV